VVERQVEIETAAASCSVRHFQIDNFLLLAFEMGGRNFGHRLMTWRFLPGTVPGTVHCQMSRIYGFFAF